MSLTLVRSDSDRIAELEKRIADLEDVLLELEPLADAFEINMETFFRARTQEEADERRHAFMRDTLHMDQHVFRRAKHLLRNK